MSIRKPRTPAASCAGIPTCWLGISQPPAAFDIELWVAGSTTRSRVRSQSFASPLHGSRASAGAAAAARATARTQPSAMRVLPLTSSHLRRNRAQPAEPAACGPRWVPLPATVAGVSDLARSPGGPPSRRGREARAYRLVVTAGVAGAVAVIGIVLAAVNVLGWGVPLLAALIAGVSWIMFRRTVSS